jgi:5-methyltetrahydropteroyltriglutamate--homocysteine methyltransferase
MAISHNLGFARIGAARELKHALESFWRGDGNADQLESTAARLRRRHWVLQKEEGIDLLPVGDFSLYDHMLDMSVLLGAVPQRFGTAQGPSDLAHYFAMARGSAAQPALEMTKWFDTNYHYLVPELHPGQRFALCGERLFGQIAEAQLLGVRTKAVVVGPITFLYLSKARGQDFDRLELLAALLPVYEQLLSELRKQGVEWVQMDEPALALDLPPAWLEALSAAYTRLARAGGPACLLSTYFGDISRHAERLKALPVAGLHVDLVRAPGQLDSFLADYPEDKVLSAGFVDGRNVWRTDLVAALEPLERAQALLGERLWVAPSCSLLHCPVDLRQERKLDAELQGWLAFGAQKLGEVALLARALNSGRAAVLSGLDAATAALAARRASPRIHDTATAERAANVRLRDLERGLPFERRQSLQRERFRLPVFPTTTIGSFPQTESIRAVRAAHKRGEVDIAAYETAIRKEIAHAVEKQEELGLDVLVHGEAERNDMVEYFGEQLRGFAFTEHGWVQSYGSRCVKPPIIYGDVSRPAPMTLRWFEYAQSLSAKPMKGMLTGPVTILQWSFVRDDQPRAATAKQIALAIRDEVLDLEAAGAGMIQIDEPALREGLPLARADWSAYLDWSVDAFRLSAAGVRDDTQIHTHMCYAEFNDILPAIAAMDADVITIETSRSDMELLRGFGEFRYANEIGPGVYDIHSPRVPRSEDIVSLLERACGVVDPRNLWVNPDCGLKTRAWRETESALQGMVAAARSLRSRYGAGPLL